MLIGDIYAQAQVMFDDDMYLQLLEIIKHSLKSSEDKADVEAVSTSFLYLCIPLSLCVHSLQCKVIV